MDHTWNGQVFKTGCLVPASFPTSLPHVSESPGFRAWTPTEIEDAIRAKPMSRRQQFAGDHWFVNQLAKSSCNAAACVGALRRAMALNGRNDIPQLSWEFLYAQLKPDGTDPGSQLVESNTKVLTKGAPPLNPKAHPLNRDIDRGDYSDAEYKDALNYRADQCFAIDTELELATVILSGQGACVVAVDVGDDFSNLDSRERPPDGGGAGNHAVGVDDVGLYSGVLEFDCFNSWGLDWGNGGRCRLTWKENLARTVKYHRFYAIVASTNPFAPAPVANV